MVITLSSLIIDPLLTIFSKILENILLNRMHDYLYISDNQFGFKQAHSTCMLILLLKELLRFYCDHSWQ